MTVCVLHGTDKMSVSLQNTSKLYKTTDDMITAMQKEYLFPFDSNIPYYCCAAVLVFNEQQNAIVAYIPKYPLYYGYKLFVYYDRNGQYNLIFNPDVASIFDNNSTVFKDLTFTSLPFHLSHDYLIDDPINRELNDWLKSKTQDIVNLSTELKSNIESNPQLLDGYKLNQYILEFLQKKYQENSIAQHDKLVNEFHDKLKKVTNLRKLSIIVDEAHIEEIAASNLLHIKTISCYIKQLEKHSYKFLEEVEMMITENQYKCKPLDIENCIIKLCEETYRKCEDILTKIEIDQMDSNKQLLFSIHNTFHQTPLHSIFQQGKWFVEKLDKSSPLIYTDSNNVLKTHTVLWKFLSERNNYYENEFSKEIDKQVKIFTDIVTEDTNISTYTLKQLYDFENFHENTKKNYQSCGYETMAHIVSHYGELESIYSIKVNKVVSGGILSRNGKTLNAMICLVKDVFLIDDQNIKIENYFKTQLKTLPISFWDLTKNILHKLNDMSYTIGIFSGCKNCLQFEVQFNTNTTQNNSNIVTSKDDLKCL